MGHSQVLDQSVGHHNLFNFFRFFFASFVLFGHCYPLLYGAKVGDRAEPLAFLTQGQLGAGSFSVGFFFTLSGFLITQSWAKSPNLKVFVVKRAARILPGFYAACLFCAIVVPLILTGRPLAIVGGWRAMDVASVLVFLHLPATTEVLRDNPVPYALNGSLWTIPIEILCYLIVAALGIVGLMRRRIFILVCFVFVWLAHCGVALTLMSDQVEPGALAALMQLPRLLTYFLAGAVFYLFKEQIPFSPRWACGSLILLFLGSILTGKADLVVPIAGSYLLFYIGLGLRIHCLMAFGKRIDLSYGIYLYAFPVQQIVVALLFPSLTPLLLFALVWPITCLLALCSWFLVERPALRLLAKSARSRRSSDEYSLARWSEIIPKRN